MLTAKLYTYAGTLIKTLATAEGLTIRAARGQEVRRSCSFALAVTSQDLADVRQPGRRVKVFDSDSTQLFSGYIDSVRPAIAGDAYMEVSARDRAKVFKLARFAADVTYSDASYTDTTRTILAATASSELQAGDAIQGQGKVYGRRLQATVLGITSDVEPSAESGSILTGDYSVSYTADGLTLLTLTQYIDLLASESVNGITVTTTGTGTPYYSTDGATWTAYTSGTVTARYIKIVTTKAAGPITVGVEVTAAATSPASNVLTDNAAAWRPRSTDLERILTLQFASAAVNGLLLKCGVSNLDRETAYIVDVEALVSGAWQSAAANQLVVGGLNEITFAAVTATGLRVSVKQKTAPAAIRYASVVYCDSSATIDQVIETILATEGETDYSQVATTRRAPAGHAVTFEAGEEKLRAMQDLAESVGMEFFYDEQDRPVLRPTRWADPLDADIPEYDAALEWAPEYGDASLYNQVLALYEAGDASLTATATNDRGDSGTSTVNIGTRTSPVLRYPLANTQAKLDLVAQEALARYSKAETRGQLRLPWAAGDTLPEPGGIVRVVDALTSTDEQMRVVSTELREGANEVTLQLEVETL